MLGSLAELPLMLTATILTAVNDNAAITYLATLVPNLAEASKYAVVARGCYWWWIDGDCERPQPGWSVYTWALL